AAAARSRRARDRLAAADARARSDGRDPAARSDDAADGHCAAHAQRAAQGPDRADPGAHPRGRGADRVQGQDLRRQGGAGADATQITMPKFQPRRGPAPRILGVILAGGEGKRLMPLTADRAKPAVPIGGRYRLIDFVLSNFVNSGILKIKVLTQYKSDSLNTHLARGWRLPQMLDFYVEPVPAQMRLGTRWFLGSADALHQSLNVVTDEDPDLVCVFSSDNIYRMDVRQLVDDHIDSGAEMTVAAIPVPRDEATEFGVIGIDEKNRMTSFTEKPSRPAEMPGRPGWALASAGNYIWNTATQVAGLRRDAESDSQHDFGRNMLLSLLGRLPVNVYDFMRNDIPGGSEGERGYWRDVGTIPAYYEANMDLLAVVPRFD